MVMPAFGLMTRLKNLILHMFSRGLSEFAAFSEDVSSCMRMLELFLMSLWVLVLPDRAALGPGRQLSGSDGNLTLAFQMAGSMCWMDTGEAQNGCT